MRHYAIGHWADFSRGLLDEQERTESAAHLAGGCQECRSLSAFTAKLNAACARLASNPVPESMVRAARAIFPAWEGEQLQRGNYPSIMGLRDPTSIRTGMSTGQASAKQ